MQIMERRKLKPFITKDKSEIKEFYRSQSMSLAEATVEVGQTTECHLHRRSEEIYYIVEGEGLMEIEGEEEGVSKQQAVIIPSGKKHRITNIGDGQLRFLCLCSPSYSDEDTVLVRGFPKMDEDEEKSY
jgi:mannose-6-phosphate isomerase-like protein (cupin superfamily)